MRILVTGGAGFIGSHLVDALVERGDFVRVLDNLSNGRREHVNATAEFFESDICESDSTRELFQGIDAVVHLAAFISIPLSVEQPWEAHRHNVDGTLNVLRAAHEAGVRRVVFASSCAVYGVNGLAKQQEQARLCPQNPYAVQKVTGEEYCSLFTELWGLETVRLRFFNVYGSHRQLGQGGYASAMRSFFERKQGGQPLVIYGDGYQTRDFVHWSDVVAAIERATEKDTPAGNVYNIGSGRETSVRELADFFGGERTYLPARLGEMRRVVADISQAQRELLWSPKISLEEGLARFIAREA